MRKHSNGFTLIELMVVVLVVTILTVIAVPSYTYQVRKSHRSEGKSILLDLAAREERYMATNGIYSTTASDLGLTAWGSVGSGYYTIAAPTVTAPTASTSTTAALPATFTLTATATNLGKQSQDSQCYTMSVTNAGVQSSTNGTSPTVGCWP